MALQARLADVASVRVLSRELVAYTTAMESVHLGKRKTTCTDPFQRKPSEATQLFISETSYTDSFSIPRLSRRAQAGTWS